MASTTHIQAKANTCVKQVLPSCPHFQQNHTKDPIHQDRSSRPLLYCSSARAKALYLFSPCIYLPLHVQTAMEPTTSPNAAAAAAANDPAANNAVASGKVDPITALQEAIDGLSLSMFESLRSLRDAVAPESGNLGVNPNAAGANAGEQAPPDSEELWHLYRKGDARVREMMHKGETNPTILTERKEFMRLQARMEMQKDTELVLRLANSVLSKSTAIDTQVDTTIPGMTLTRTQQMERIAVLLRENQKVQQELQQVYDKASERRTKCRQAILTKTSQVLGIEEQDNHYYPE